MKFRKLANKLLVVAVMVILICGTFLGTCAPSLVGTAVQTADTTQLTKTYYFDKYNWNKPSTPDKALYDALGIKVYNDYLSALSATKNLNNVIIAVVDTGIDADYPAFSGRILTEYAMDFSQGIPTTESNHWNVDQNGHGTHVAGIIADITLSNVKILPIKIFHGFDNQSNNAALNNALIYLAALKNGVSKKLYKESGSNNIIETNVTCNKERKKLSNIVAVNLSVGTPGYALNNTYQMYQFQDEKKNFQPLIDNYLWNNDILPIIAAGNRAGNPENESGDYAPYINQAGEKILAPYYSLPGACDHVLSVSAYDNMEQKYQLAEFSYYNDRISVAAPGVEIWSACSDDIVAVLDESSKDESHLLTEGYTIYTYTYDVNGNTKTATWIIRKDLNDNYYFRSNGTSMATPFVTACYAMLMSDSSKTTIADLGISWQPNNAESTDRNFYNAQHKALLAAAATDGAHSINGYEARFGYGTVNVSGFVPDSNGNVAAFTDIDYEPKYDVYSDQTLLFDNEAVDWYSVCVVLLVAVILFWVFNAFRSHFRTFTRRRETNDDEQQ